MLHLLQLLQLLQLLLWQGGPHLARPGGYSAAGLLSLDASSVGLAADAVGGSKGAGMLLELMHPTV